MKIGPRTIALFLWVALVGPVSQASATPGGRPGLVLAIGACGSIATLLSGQSRWWLRLAIAFGTAAAIAPTHGELIAAWTGASILLAAWVAQYRPPLPILPRPGSEVTAPVAVLCGVAAWVGHSPTATWQPLVPFGMACLIPASPGGGARLSRFGARVGTIAATAVSSATFFVVGSVVVIIPWMGHRLLRVDPLGTGPGWAARERRSIRPGRLWEPEAAAPRRPQTRVHRARTICFAAGIAVIAVLVLRPWSTGDSGPSAALVAPVDSADDRPWYDEYREDIAWVNDERVALRPFEVYRLLDVRTRHVNIDQGDRVSWTPPPCECDRVKVWLYGGGAAFGLEQRDQHTVASELARIAAENGLALDVTNRGVPGQLHWRAALRFGWDLTFEAPPDIAVFYDGAEEVIAAIQLTERGLGDVRAPYETTNENLYDEISGVEGRLPPPPGVEALGWPTVPRGHGSRLAGALAAERYDRSREISRNTAAAYGIPIRYVWHPSRRADVDEPDPFLDASARLPADVLDLTEKLSNGGGAAFADDVHHDERGARLVAEALFADLEPQLRTLSEGGDAS